MDIKKLFTGIGLVIDDKALNNNVEDKIGNIVEELERSSIPLVKYDHLPNLDIVNNLQNVNFILLDWQLYDTMLIVDGDYQSIMLDDGTITDNDKKNTNFIIHLLNSVFVPIFIFSNSDGVRDKLVQNGIDNDLLNELPVFIKGKGDIYNEAGEFKLFTELKEWMSDKPSVYVLKEWSKSFNQSKENLFREFSKSSKHWPQIIWNAAKADSVDESEELSLLLMQNITSRMAPVKFEEGLITNDQTEPTNNELLSVMQSQRYMQIDQGAMAMVGDIYEFPDDYVDDLGIHRNPTGKKVAVNIRPTCDCVYRNEYDKNVYLLFAKEMTAEVQKERYNSSSHNFNEHLPEAIVGPILNKKYYIFLFQELVIKPFEEIEKYRSGRILEPFISHITERYSLYLHRHALPSIPEVAVVVKPKGEKLDKVKIKVQEEEISDLKQQILNLKENQSCLNSLRKNIKIILKNKSNKRRK